MARFLVPAVALSAVVGSGLVHGYWTGRWEGGEKAAAAAALLRRLPMSLGDWQGQDLDADPGETRQLSASLYRRYVNQRSGATVVLVLASGRPGPVSIHSPDVCYVASGYDAAQGHVFSPKLDAGLPRAEFRTAHFVKTKSGGQTHVRVWWSWNAGGTWSVPENPRVTFAAYPVLYKLHAMREMTGANETLDEDPGQDLLRLLLAEFHKSVVMKS
jgi:Protein of unknown function (DUF3485)